MFKEKVNMKQDSKKKKKIIVYPILYNLSVYP